MDSRIVDFSFSKPFMKLILDQPIPRTIASLKTVDRALALSFERVQAYATAKRAIEGNAFLDEAGKMRAVEAVRIQDARIEDMALDFTLPGYAGVELKPGGRELSVDMENVEEYVDAVVEWTLGRGVRAQVKAFKAGFSKVFSVRDLQSFTPEELVNIFGNDEKEDWSVESELRDYSYISALLY